MGAAHAAGYENAGTRIGLMGAGLGLEPKRKAIGIRDPAVASDVPPLAPDLADEMIRKQMRDAALSLKTGRTRQSTFVASNAKTGGAY